MKGFIELLKNIFVFFFIHLWWLWVIPLVFYVGYLIASSDLPNWFKFFLLS